MNIGDKVEGIQYPYLGISGYLMGNGMIDSYMYIRTQDDLVSFDLETLNKSFQVVKKADYSIPVKTYCMFGSV